jgi:hypothetical protein
MLPLRLYQSGRRAKCCDRGGLIAWLLPIRGFPITIAALVPSLLGMKSPARKTLAIISVAPAGSGLVPTVISAAFGAYLGATGQL